MRCGSEKTRGDVQSADERWMRLALEEAAGVEGRTRPNPPVGCVIVRGGREAARGRHRYAGGPHAEADALSCGAIGDFAGATMYVTLEPCSTTGRTPPCTDAIIRHKIARVVISSTDLNPKHSGRGVGILRQAGIEVTTGVLAKESERMLAPFFKWVTTGIPYLTLKIAQTLDGAIADHAGRSKWITCDEARAEVGKIRNRCDAVLVGAGTVVADNPSLLRPGETGREQPGYRIIMDASGRVPKDSKIFTDGFAALTIYATSDKCSAERIAAVRAAGAEVWVLPLESAGTSATPRISIPHLLRKAGESGLLHILCEGGASVASSVVYGGYADELAVFISPSVFGAGSLRALGGYPFDLTSAPSFEIMEHRIVGKDLLVTLKNDSRQFSALGV